MERHTTYFYRPVQNMVWGGVIIYDIDNKWLNIFHKIYSFFLLAIFGYGYIATEIIHAYKHFNDMEEFTLTLCYIIPHLIGISKVILFSLKRQTFGKLITSLEHDEFLPNIDRGGSEEQVIIGNAVRRTNDQARVFAIIVTAMIGSRLIQVSLQTEQEIFDEARNISTMQPIYPYPSTLPFAISSDKTISYIVEFAYEAFSMILFGWYLGNSDTILTGLIIHATAQFKIVTNALLTISEKAERDISKLFPELHPRTSTLRIYGEESVDPCYQEALNGRLLICVKNCIRHHNLILDLLEILENAFNEIMVIQFLGELLTICIALYQTSLLPITNPAFVSMLSFTLGLTFQLLIYCWNGNELSVYSVQVADAAYNCRWLSASRELKLSLMLITQRAQRISYLTAGKFSKLSLETFMAILRGSVSYFMVLRQMHEGEI